jgi:hypothetical protein
MINMHVPEFFHKRRRARAGNRVRVTRALSVHEIEDGSQLQHTKLALGHKQFGGSKKVFGTS